MRPIPKLCIVMTAALMLLTGCGKDKSRAEHTSRIDKTGDKSISSSDAGKRQGGYVDLDTPVFDKLYAGMTVHEVIRAFGEPDAESITDEYRGIKYGETALVFQSNERLFGDDDERLIIVKAVDDEKISPAQRSIRFGCSREDVLSQYPKDDYNKNITDDNGAKVIYGEEDLQTIGKWAVGNEKDISGKYMAAIEDEDNIMYGVYELNGENYPLLYSVTYTFDDNDELVTILMSYTECDYVDEMFK